MFITILMERLRNIVRPLSVNAMRIPAKRGGRGSSCVLLWLKVGTQGKEAIFHLLYAFLDSTPRINESNGLISTLSPTMIR